MPRVDLIPDDNHGADELIDAVRLRRGGTLLKIDRAMLHSRAIVSGWSALLGAVNQSLRTDARTRELVVCAVGELNHAKYEVTAHGPRFLGAGGSQEQLDALKDVRTALANTNLFDAYDLALLRLAYEMTVDVEVQQSTFDEVTDVLAGDDELVVEIVTIIASYNMVTRFVVALDVIPENGNL